MNRSHAQPLRRIIIGPRIASLAVLFFAPAVALGDPATECGGANQVEIGACVSETLSRVDATVEIYLGVAQTAAVDLDEITGRTEAVPALEAAQAAWSAYRDAHCAYVGATFTGGSGAGIAIDGCKVDLGRDRADALMRFAR